MKSIICTGSINPRLIYVSSILNPLYNQVSGNNIWLSDKMIDKIARAFPRGKARNWYIKYTKESRTILLKNGLVDKSNRIKVKNHGLLLEYSI
ncbi:MAG: hypothetical protein WC679_00085 [Bacteroidales bacterium]|jgi:hypothetical protein